MGCKVNKRQNHPIVPGFVQDSNSPSFYSSQPIVITSEKNLQGCASPVASVDCTNKKGNVTNTHCLHLYILIRGKLSVTDSYLVDEGHFLRWHPLFLYFFCWLVEFGFFLSSHIRKSRVGNGSRGGSTFSCFSFLCSNCTAVPQHWNNSF